MCWFDDVERDKKLELLILTLYRNLVMLSETMDLSDLLSKRIVKTNEVNMSKSYITKM